MTNAEKACEFDRWLTLRRIAHSGFTAIIFDGLYDGSWDQGEAMRLSMSALRAFGNGNCYFLASAVAHITGWPIPGFLRSDEGEGLVHAAICDPSTGDAFDILVGVRSDTCVPS